MKTENDTLQGRSRVASDELNTADVVLELAPESLASSPPDVSRDISLDISGAGLFLSGRFADWESGVSMGPDLDELQLRLAIDTTSARAGSSGPAADTQLFSFRGRDAIPVAAGVYQVDGEFTGHGSTRPLQMQVETSVGHSAVFLLSFQARRGDFGPDWTRLLSNVISFGAHEPEPTLPASRWLTTPILAAA